LWNEVKSYKDLTHFETAYVVRIHNIHQLAEAQECFTFVHPNNEKPIDNSRYKSMKFKVPFSTTLHGYAGYFDAQLYADVHIST
jgi:protein arginine N-methyltransferase 5